MFERVRKERVINQINEIGQNEFWAASQYMSHVEQLEDSQVIEAINQMKTAKVQKMIKVLRKIIRGFSMKYPQYKQVDQILIEYQSDRDCIEIFSDSIDIHEKLQVLQNEIEEQQEEEVNERSEISEAIDKEQMQQNLDYQLMTTEYNKSEQILQQILKLSIEQRKSQLVIQRNVDDLSKQSEQTRHSLIQLQNQLIKCCNKQTENQNQEEQFKDNKWQYIPNQYKSDEMVKQLQYLVYQDMIQKQQINILQQQQVYLYTQLMNQNLFITAQNQFFQENQDRMKEVQDLMSEEVNISEEQYRQTPKFQRQQIDTIPKETSDNIFTSRGNKEIQQLAPINISQFEQESQIPLKEYNKTQERAQSISQFKKPYKPFCKWIKENPHHIKSNNSQSQKDVQLSEDQDQNQII